MVTSVELLTPVIVALAGIPVPEMLNPTSAAVKFAESEPTNVEAGAPDASSTDRAPGAFSTSNALSASMATVVGRLRCSTSPDTLRTKVLGAIPGPDTTRFTHADMPVPAIPGDAAVSDTTPAGAASTATVRAAPVVVPREAVVVDRVARRDLRVAGPVVERARHPQPTRRPRVGREPTDDRPRHRRRRTPVDRRRRHRREVQHRHEPRIGQPRVRGVERTRSRRESLLRRAPRHGDADPTMPPQSPCPRLPSVHARKLL